MRPTLRILALLMALAAALSLASCSKYPPVSSSKKEKATVFTADGAYEAPYELYRFVFLNARSGEGDVSKMNAEERAAVFARCDARARAEISRVYAVFALCERNGIDPYEKEIDKAVKAAVTDAIENEGNGFGDYDTYLKALKEGYMNDSVFRFYLRLNILEERLARAMHSDAFVKEDDQTVRDYFKSDAAVRATWIYIPYGSAAYENFTPSMLEELVADAKAATDEEFVRTAQQYLQTLYMPEELSRGFYFGKYQLDAYYEKLTETAFSLAEGETSELIHSGDGVYIVRRLPKVDAYIDSEDNIEELREYYLLDSFYRVLSEESTRVLGTLKASALYEDITLDSVKMD